MHPVLVELGPFSIRFYGLMYVIGILLALVMVRREARRKGLPLTDEDVANFILVLVFGGIVGARLYYVLFQWDYYRTYPWSIPAVWQGGLAFHGGQIGGLLAGVWFARRYHIPLWRLGDIIAPKLSIYRELTLEAARKSPQLIVWPEAAVRSFLREDPRRSQVESLARQTRAYLLLGAPDRQAGQPQNGRVGLLGRGCGMESLQSGVSITGFP